MRHTIIAGSLVVLIFAGNTAHAEGIANTLTVDNVRVDRSGVGYVRFTTPLISTPPACATTYPNHLSFNTNTPGGQAILSIALTAKASGKRIYAKGAGTCDIYTVVESWSWGYLAD